MIEDESIGLKVSENEDISLWTKIVNARKESIKQLEQSMKVERVFLGCAEEKLATLHAQVNQSP